MTTYPTRTLADIDRFFTQESSILHFLLLSIFFAVIIVVFGEPTGLLVFTARLSPMNPHLQIAITSVAGLLTLILSRILLFYYARHRSIAPMGCLIWTLVELIATIAVLTFTLWQVSGGGRLILAPLAGDFLLGVMAIETIPYVISYLVFRLREEQGEVARLQEQLNQLLPTESLASATAEHTINFYDKGNKLVFSTVSNNVLYIEAADNYVNIHYLDDGHENTFILHNTLKELERRLAGTTLLRCHRGYIVNMSNVKLLRKEGSTLLLELAGGSKTIPVTKTYAADITARLAPDNK